MTKKVLIVEDQFVEANDLKLMLTKAGYHVCGIARSVDMAFAFFEKEEPSLVLVDIFLKDSKTGIEFGRFLFEKGINFIYISANSNQEVLEAAKATQPAGFIVKPFRERDLLVTLEIAEYRYTYGVEAQRRKENVYKEKLSKIKAFAGPIQEKFKIICEALQSHIPFDFLLIGPISNVNQSTETHAFLRIAFDEYQWLGVKELAMVSNQKKEVINTFIASICPKEVGEVFLGNDFARTSHKSPMRKFVSDSFRMCSELLISVTLRDKRTYFLDFYSRRDSTYLPEHLAMINALNHEIEEALNEILEVEEDVITQVSVTSSQAVAERKKKEHIFSGIIGKSHLLLNVFDQIEQVAPVDTSVLILGESGTGKERIATCIHELSPRRASPLVKINCAALPANLIESELFGHEKGAFTGATKRRIGKFELAHKGTIFLDEIGEIPLELQAKLLRVLQEREIERVGGSSSIKVDVRIIAATNRNLEKEVGNGHFRLDLYYRLNIFPILVPSLRDRKEDILLLAEHFIKNFNQKMGKNIHRVSPSVQQKLNLYSWPGNIRELENLMERAVIVAKDDIINEINLPTFVDVRKDLSEPDDMPIKSIEQNERDHIIGVLKKCNNKIYGAMGAAALLGVPPTTLNSKIKRLGIIKKFL